MATVPNEHERRKFAASNLNRSIMAYFGVKGGTGSLRHGGNTRTELYFLGICTKIFLVDYTSIHHIVLLRLYALRSNRMACVILLAELGRRMYRHSSTPMELPASRKFDGKAVGAHPALQPFMTAKASLRLDGFILQAVLGSMVPPGSSAVH
jgi:hypothetical protein